MRFEAPATTARPFELRADPPGPIVPTLPAISLGLRRVTSSQVASNLLERSVGSGHTEAYVSKVGIEWKPAESKVNFLREGLGIRLDGNDRMTVRLRKGVLGVYMQRKF